MNNDTRERFTLRIPTILMETLQNEAKKMGVSLNALVLQVLWSWSEKKGDGDEYNGI